MRSVVLNSPKESIKTKKNPIAKLFCDKGTTIPRITFIHRAVLRNAASSRHGLICFKPAIPIIVEKGIKRAMYPRITIKELPYMMLTTG